MAWLKAFFAQNFILVYFFYGLAFFVMGLAILLESRRSSQFHLARAMRSLAGFGIIHGLHEWFEMFQLLEAAGATNIPGWLLSELIRLTHLVTSFALLIVFGVQLIFANREIPGRGRRHAYVAAVALLGVWGASSYLTARYSGGHAANPIDVADILARYTLGMPGALLAGWAILLEQQTFRQRQMPQFGRAFLWAAGALLVYGLIGQLFPRPSFFFPANVLNSESFWAFTGVPVQLFRALAAVAMAFAFIRALHVFEVESRGRLARAQAERLAAQQAALDAQRQARVTTEALNAELQLAVHNLTILHGLSRDLSATLDREAIVHEIFPRFILGEDRVAAGFLFLDETQGESPAGTHTLSQAAAALAPRRRQMALQIGHQVCQSRQPVYWDGVSRRTIQDGADGPGQAWEADTNSVTILGLPLAMQETVVGALVVCAAAEIGFTAQDLSLFSTAARQFGASLHNAALYRETRQREARRGALLSQVVGAQEQERQRIARELHDGPGQTLTALGLGIAALRARQETRAADREPVSNLQGLSNQAMQELRDIIADLRPSVLDDLGLVAAVRSQVQALQERTGIQAELEVRGSRYRLPLQLETIVFRIVQEALTNIAKHARAQTATVVLSFADDALRAEVTDDGCGFEPDRVLKPEPGQNQGWGLLGMRERVELVGGSCQVESRPQQGTTVFVHVPLSPADGIRYDQDQTHSG